MLFRLHVVPAVAIDRKLLQPFPESENASDEDSEEENEQSDDQPQLPVCIPPTISDAYSISLLPVTAKWKN